MTMQDDHSDYRTAAMFFGGFALAISCLVIGWSFRAFFMNNIDHMAADDIKRQAVSLGYGEYIDHGAGFWSSYRTFQWKVKP
jgi:hypothetical protein